MSRPSPQPDYPALVGAEGGAPRQRLSFSLRGRGRKDSPPTSSGCTGFAAGTGVRSEHGFALSRGAAEHGFALSRGAAEHGFALSRGAAEHGFTLVELLVALSIFAMVSAAGVMLLRASIDTQTAVSKRLGEGGGVNRLRSILASELASAQPRPVRDQSGNPLPAFVGEGGAIAFVHAADSGGVEGALGRSRYALEGGALVRQASVAVDGANPGDPAPLVREVTAARWRFRALDGAWSEAWTPDDPARLPRAVELTLERRGGVPLIMRFLVAPDGLPLPGQAVEGGTP